MPCDLIQNQSVDFSSAKNHEGILADALRELGYTVTQSGNTLQFYKGSISGSYANGQFNTSSSRYSADAFNVDAVKQAFGRNVVRTASKKYGWNIRQDAKNPNRFVVTKRV